MRRSERFLLILHQLHCLALDIFFKAGGLLLAQMFTPSLLSWGQISHLWMRVHPPGQAPEQKAQISCSRWISIKAMSSLIPVLGKSPGYDAVMADTSIP